MPVSFTRARSRSLRPSAPVSPVPVWVLECLEGRVLLTTYYVATTGVDDPAGGTPAAPWKSISYAASRVAADQNHTIQVGAGTFTEATGKRVVLKSGTNLVGAGIDQTIVKGLGLYGNLFWLESNFDNTTSQRITGFTIDGQNKALADAIIVNRRHYVEIDHLRIINTSHAAVEYRGEYNDSTRTSPPPENRYVIGGKIHDLQIEHCSGTSYYIKSNGARHYTTWWGAISLAQNLNFEVYNNTIVNTNPDDGGGIKGFRAGGWHRGLKLYNNTITVAPKHAVNPGETSDWGASASIEMTNVLDQCEVYGNTVNQWTSFPEGDKRATAYSLDFRNNRVVLPIGAATREGIEVPNRDARVHDNHFENVNIGAVSYAALTVDPLIYRNTFVGNSGDNSVGIKISGSSSNSNWRVFNNVFDQFETGVSVHYSTDGLNVTNNAFLRQVPYSRNILFITTATGQTFNNLTFDHNLFYDYTALRTGNTTTPVTFSNNLGQTAPGVDPGLQGITTPTLARPDPYYQASGAGSAVVDAGVAIAGITDGFLGAAPDIGRFEFVPALPLQAEAPFGLGSGQYVAGTLHGQGPADLGFTGAWSGATQFQVTANGLFHPSHPARGAGALYASDRTTNATTAITRSTAAALGPDGKAYLSFLLRADNPAVYSSTRVQTGSVDLLGFAQTGSDPNNLRVAYYDGSTFVTSATAFSPGQTYLGIVEVAAGASATPTSPGAGNENLRYWVFDTAAAVPTTLPATAHFTGSGNAAYNSGGLNAFSVKGKLVNATVDEVRATASWPAVAPTEGTGFGLGSGQYAAGTLHGQGPADLGFTGTWSGATQFQVTANGLFHPSHPARGAGALYASDRTTNATTAITRSTAAALGPDGKAYLSFLLRADNPAVYSSTRVQTGSVDLLGFAQTGSDPNNLRVAYYDGSTFVTSATAFTPGQTYLGIVEVAAGASATPTSPGAGNENLRYWFFDTAAAVPTTLPATAHFTGSGNAAHNSGGLNAFSVKGKLVNATVDEVRFGTTWGQMV